jgi:anti-anti-sigma regulatory factor
MVVEAMARFWFHARLMDRSYRVQLYGELDGSSACQVLDAVAQAPAVASEVVVNVDGLTRVEAFGFEVLARRVRSSARGRPVRMTGRCDHSQDMRGTGRNLG